MALDQADPGRTTGAAPPVIPAATVPWLVSAGTADGLRARARRLLDFAEARPATGIAGIGHALAHECEHHRHRAAIVAQTRAELLANLRALAAGEPAAHLLQGEGGAAKTVF